MLLQGSLREFNLPNILQLVKMSASTGALSLRRGDAHGKIFFSGGSICYAFARPQSVPIGQRFVNARHITPAQLREASALQRESSGSGRLGAILVDMGLTDQATLDAMVTEQIQDTVFDFFGWPDGEFEFNDNEVAVDEDIFVEMQVETVIMESCRRIDELEFILEQLGSLESIPRLSCGPAADQTGEIVFAAEEWNVAAHVDGHSDINTVLLDCDYDRFYGAKIMHRLFERGLITIAPPAIWSLEEGLSIGVCGSADAYREVFVATLTGGNVLRHLRTEIVDGRDVDVPVLVGRVRTGERRRRQRGLRLLCRRDGAGAGADPPRAAERCLDRPRRRPRRRECARRIGRPGPGQGFRQRPARDRRPCAGRRRSPRAAGGGRRCWTSGPRRPSSAAACARATVYRDAVAAVLRRLEGAQYRGRGGGDHLGRPDGGVSCGPAPARPLAFAGGRL